MKPQNCTFNPWNGTTNPGYAYRHNCDALKIGNLTVQFIRTLRLPEDGNTHSLPPGLGNFPVRMVEDYKDKVPAKWLEHGGVFLPMYQREAMWLSFGGNRYNPDNYCAVKVAAGKVNAISGKPWSETLEKPDTSVAGKDPVQDYMVCPNQPWLDGFNTGDGVIRQFISMPLGMGYTVEKQVTGKEDVGGLQFIVYPAKPGAIKLNLQGYRTLGGCLTGSLGEYAAASYQHDGQAVMSAMPTSMPTLSADEDYYVPTRKSVTRGVTLKGAEMGLAAGGKMTQKIYEDTYGIDSWDTENAQRIFVHIVNSQMWTEITGEPPPPTPVNAHTYTAHGYPWFNLYDEDKAAVQGSGTLANVKPVSEMDKEKGFENQQDDSPIEESQKQVVGLPGSQKPTRKMRPVKLGNKEVPDGKW